MNHDISAMLQRTNEVRCAEGVVDDEGDTVLVSYSCYAFEVEDVGVGIAEGLGIYYFRVGLDGSFEGFEVVDINNCIGDALRSQCVGNEVVRATIEVVGSHDVVAILHDVLQGVGDSGSTRGHSQSSHTTLEGSDAILKHTLG